MLALSEWLSTFAFSRRLRHLPRDFSDAVLLAELLAQQLPPGAVQLHNYPPASGFQQKLVNWETLNRKVLTPLRCELPPSLLEELAAAAPSAIALALVQVKKTIDQQTPLRSPTKTNAAVGNRRLPSPSQQPQMTSPPPSPLAATSSIPRANATSKTRAKSAGAETLSGSKSVSSPVRQLRPPSPTKRSRSSPTRASQPLLRDFLPLPQDRPSPEKMASLLSRVLHKAEGSSPKCKSSRSTEGPKLKVIQEEAQETRSRASTCDSSEADDAKDPLCVRVGVQRREWPASHRDARQQSPPSGFTTRLTRHKLSSLTIITDELTAGPSQAPVPVESTDPISVVSAHEEVTLELCVAPPTVFPRVVVDVDAVLSSAPVRFRRRQSRA